MAKTISDENIRLNIIINGNPAQKQLLDLEKSTRALTKETEGLKLQRKQLELADQKGSAEWKKLDAIIKANTVTIDNNKATMKELQNQVGLTGLTMHQLGQKARILRGQLANAVPNGEAYNKYKVELQQVEARIKTLRVQAKRAKLSLGSLAQGFNKYAALGASVLAMGTGVVLSLQKIIDYNGKLSDSQADVMKTTGMTKEEVDELTKSFGMLITRTSRVDLLKIAEEGGRIGIVKEEIGEFVEVMNKASVALGDSFTGGVEEVASKLGKLKLLFKETKNIGVEKAYNAIGSAINELGANGVATEVNIASFATRIGSLPDALKPTIQDALGLGAAFEESGVQAEISGRAYSIFLGEAAKSSDKFAEVMGITTEEVENLINTNPTEFFLEFSDKLAKASDKGTDTAKTLADLGLSADGVKKIVGAAGNNVNRFRELLDLSNKSMIEGTSLTKEYNIKNNNLAATLDKIKKKTMGWFSSKGLVSWLTAAAQGFASLIGATEKSSDSLIEERYNANLLVATITSLNKGDERRNTLIDDLNAKYPSFLANLDAEKVTNGELLTRLEDVNAEYREKIRLAAYEEEIIDNKKTAIALQREEMDLIKGISHLGKKFRHTSAGTPMEQIVKDFQIAADAGVIAKGLNAGIQNQYERLAEIKKELLVLEQEAVDLQKEKSKVVVNEEEDEPKGTKEGDEKLVGGVILIFKNGKWVKKEIVGGGGGGNGDTTLSPEDQAIADSKEKLKQFLEEFEADEEIRKELLKFEKAQRAEEEEVLRLENKYQKMAEDAGFETVLAAGLEDAKEFELNAIREKWENKKLKEKEVNDKKYEALDKKHKAALKKAQEDLELAKKNALSAGVDFLGSILDKQSAIYKVMFGLEKALAIAQIIKSSTAAIQLANLNEAKIPWMIPSPIGIPFPNPGKPISLATTKATNQATKLGALTSIASIVGTAIQGFEDGLYPVVRQQDGKNFNASFGGQTTSGMVNKPTVFMAGENGPELIVDAAAHKQIDPAIKYAFHREIARVKGFESGYYPDSTSKPTDSAVSSEASNVANIKLIEVLERASNVLEKLDETGVIAYLSNDLKTAKEIKESIADYEKLRTKNKV